MESFRLDCIIAQDFLEIKDSLGVTPLSKFVIITIQSKRQISKRKFKGAQARKHTHTHTRKGRRQSMNDTNMRSKGKAFYRNATRNWQRQDPSTVKAAGQCSRGIL